eukprot:11619555-Karenia_brevis.AAC.1
MTRLPPQPNRPPPGLSAITDNLPAESFTDSGPARLPITQPSAYHTVVPDRHGAAAVEPPAPDPVAIAP